MGETLRRFVWFFFVSSAVAYAFFLVVGSAIHTQAITETHTVVARDSLKPGTHYLAGMVMVRSTCAQLSVRAEKLSEDTYLLQFTTWTEPSLADCVEEDTPRSFRSVVFAPAAGVRFVATLDDEPIPLVVIPVVARD